MQSSLLLGIITKIKPNYAWADVDSSFQLLAYGD